MLDQFLTKLLIIVIAVDVVGAVAYFVLGAMARHRRRILENSIRQQSPPPPYAAQKPNCGRWQPASIRLGRLFRWRQRQIAPPATEADFVRLRRILSSFSEGLV